MSALYCVPLFTDGSWLLVVLAQAAEGLQPMCAVIQLAMSRSRRVSVVLTSRAVLLT